MIDYKARILTTLRDASKHGCTWRELKIRTGTPSRLLGRNIYSRTAALNSALLWLVEGGAVLADISSGTVRYYTTGVVEGEGALYIYSEATGEGYREYAQGKGLKREEIWGSEEKENVSIIMIDSHGNYTTN